MEYTDLPSEENENIPQSEHHSEQKTKTDKVAVAQNTILAYLHDLVFLLTGLLLLFVMLFRIVVVSGPSMKPTLYNGDYLIVLSSSVYTNPKVGDIVVISKDSFKNGEPIVKRVVATEGQSVLVEEGKVYVDGVEQEGAYTPTGYDLNYPVTVAEGCIFVMGDNRAESKDSRSYEIGMIDTREVLGKVLIIALPAPNEFTQKRDFSRIGLV
jgi:signal peptidase I